MSGDHNQHQKDQFFGNQTQKEKGINPHLLALSITLIPPFTLGLLGLVCVTAGIIWAAVLVGVAFIVLSYAVIYIGIRNEREQNVERRKT
jgi:hypothetical protein